MTVKLDKLRDANVRQTVAGVEVVRRARITGISGLPDRRVREALEAPGLPRYGDPHPAWPGLRLAELSLDPADTESWEATLIYRSPTAEDKAFMQPLGQKADVQWFATLVTEESSFDVAGDPMWHYYSGYPVRPLIIGTGVRFTRTTTRQLAVKHERASVQKPSIGARVLVPEAVSIENKLGLVGTINRGYWGTYAPGLWLLGAVDSRWEQGRWLNTFTFFYNAEGWRFRSVVDYGGTVPSDAVEGNGIAFFDVYPRANFAGLGFTL